MASPIIEPLEDEFDYVTCLTMGVVDQLLVSPGRKRVMMKASKVRRIDQVFAQAVQLRKMKFTHAVIPNHSFRAALTALLAGIPIRVGHDVEFRKFLLTHPVPYGQSDYDTKSNFDLIEAIHVPFRFRNPHLEISPEEADWAKSRVPPNAIGIQPGARFGEKQIPADVVRTVAAEIESAGRTIILLGGKEERETSEKLGLKAVNWVGETTIRESLAVLSQLSLMIGGDTGLMHMAAAVSCPTVTVFGPTPLEKWAHRYEPHVSIQAQGRIIRNITSEELLTAIRPRLRT